MHIHVKDDVHIYVKDDVHTYVKDDVHIYGIYQYTFTILSIYIHRLQSL